MKRKALPLNGSLTATFYRRTGRLWPCGVPDLGSGSVQLTRGRRGRRTRLDITKYLPALACSHRSSTRPPPLILHDMSSPQAAQYTFPAPIGGTPFDLDFAPSIIFAVGYAAVTILAVYRLARPKSRTLSTFGTLAFVIEQYVHLCAAYVYF